MPNRGCLAVVIYNFEPRGVQRSQVRLANEYASLGYSVDALVFSKKGSLLPMLSSDIRLVDLAASSAKSAFRRLVKYLRSDHPSVVFSAEDHVNAIILMAKLMAPKSIKYSVSCHVSPRLWAENAKFGKKAWFVKKLVLFLYPRADQCVALSSQMVEEYRDYVGLQEGVMKVIHNPVLSAKESANGDCNLHPWLKDSGLFVILGVGSLSRIKGFDVLIRAFSNLKTANLRLIILGDGPEKQALTDLAEECDISSYVDLVGYRSDPEIFMKNANLFVLSSRSEGFGNVLVEALGNGCPVVSTRCGGGAIEIMEHGRLGPLVNVDDVKGLAVAMRTVLDNPPDRKVLCESAQRFRTDVIAQKYIEDLVP